MAASDHSQFAFAAERYILDELPEQERLAFEEHFFVCASCAHEVEDLLAVRDGAIAALPHMDRHISREKKSWFHQLWVPQWALGGLAVLGVFSAYQNVQIRHFQAETKNPLEAAAPPRTLSSNRAASLLIFRKSDPLETLVFPAEWATHYPRYRASVSRRTATDLLSNDEALVKDGKITVALRPNRLETGQYILKIFGIRDGADSEVVEQSFSIQENSRE